MTRRDRYGEPISEALGALFTEHLCEDGWLGEDSEGRIRPCPVCRPTPLRRPRLQLVVDPDVAHRGAALARQALEQAKR